MKHIISIGLIVKANKETSVLAESYSASLEQLGTRTKTLREFLLNFFSSTNLNLNSGFKLLIPIAFILGIFDELSVSNKFRETILVIY